MKKESLDIIDCCDTNTVQSFLNIFTFMYDKLIELQEGLSNLELCSLLEIDHYFNMIFIFAYTWGVGGNLFEQEGNLGRTKFSQHIKLKFLSLYAPTPQEDELFNYYVDLENIKMRPWKTMMPDYVYDPQQAFFNIVVPTIETVKYKYLLDNLVKLGFNTLIIGNSGAGKSNVVSEFLNNLEGTQFIYKQLNFSAQTSAQNFQDVFTDKHKFIRYKRDLIGAPYTKKNLVFIDDINMPMPEQSGAQPPIELLRQIIGHGGFFELKKINYNYL